MAENSEDFRKFVVAAIGAQEAPGEKFTLYIPNKGRAPTQEGKQVEIADWQSWTRRALDLLGDINGGATAAPPTTGLYVDKERGSERVWEKTALVYSYIDRDAFRARIGEVKAFVHEFGHDTNQGEVFFEFEGYAYKVLPPYAV